MAPTDRSEDNVPADAADDGLVLDELGDRLSDYYSLRKTDSDEADAKLNELGANDRVDREIILELAAPKPLWLPHRFLQAHTLMVRSLEVLDRNGTRNPPLPNAGPLKPVLKYLVELVTKFIVRSHLRSVTDNVHRLYARREANCLPEDPARRLLRRGRKDLDRVMPGFKRNPLGVPTFLLGGAFLSTILGVLQEAFGLFGSNTTVTTVLTVIILLVAVLASWVILKGAAVAHRRIDLTTDKPVAALYETIGRCGNPPKDQSGTFAVISIVIVLLALLVVPLALAITVF